MAKKAAKGDFNMSEEIRDILTSSPNLSSHEVAEAIQSKHPGVKINKNSFSVAFYTGRKKLGISVSGRRGKAGKRRLVGGSRGGLDLSRLQTAAKFMREVGGADAAIEAIKQVQAVQLK